MNSIDILGRISPREILGRGVFSSNDARKARLRRKVTFRIFLESAGTLEISVDRLDLVDNEEAIEIGDNVAANRTCMSNRNVRFYGWAVVSSEDALRNGRLVNASPLESNPYHADIILPELAREMRDEQVRHAQELADASRWRDRTE